LEKELNTTLFHRTHRGLLLTEDGVRFYPYAEEILNHYQAIRQLFIDKPPALD